MPGSVRWLAVVAAFGLPGFARGHDIPNARIDRGTQVVVGPGRLRVEYEVSLAELTLVQDLRQLDGESFVGDRAALFERYAGVVGPLNARGLLVRVDEADVELMPLDFEIRVEDHPRFRFRFEAAIPERGRLALDDTNYASAEGSTRLACRAAAGVHLGGDLPPADLDAIPPRAMVLLTDAEERRARHLRIDFAPAAGASPPAVSIRTNPSRPDRARPPAAGLTWLLDRRPGPTAAGWLALACFLGMVHAIQPGHGKTLVAAASLGAAGRGVRLGLATAGCHLIGVVAVAAALWGFETERYGSIHAALARAAGFAIAAVGLFRVGRHLAGIESPHDHDGLAAGGGSLWGLGAAGGFVPCWDAVALVVVAHSVGRLGWGLALLVAFSLGLATVLVAVGWLAGRFRTLLARRPSGRDPARWLGLGSGLILAAIGLGLLAT